MIFEDSAVHALPLAYIAAGKGLQINPAPGTPLSEMVRATNLGGMCTPVDPGHLSDFINNDLSKTLEIMTSGSGEAITTHDGIVDSFITDIAKAVNAHVSFAKNVVKPVIVDMVDKATVFLKTQHDPASEITIEVKSFPKPMLNSGFETSVYKFQDKPCLEPETFITAGEMSGMGLMELMKSGSKDFDDDIGEWFINYGEVRASLIWNNLFRDFSVSKPVEAFNFQDINNKNSVDDFLAIHLLSRKLYEEVPEGVTMELKTFKNIAAQYRDWSGVKLVEFYEKYKSSIALKTLVTATDNRTKTIYVNAPIYKDWLETGGSNEVLLGLFISGNLNFSQSLIDERKEDLINQWNTYVSFKRTAVKNQSFNSFKDILTIAFADEMKVLREEEKEFVNSTPNFIEVVSKIFNDELNKLVFRDMEDIYTTCLKLVCRSRFYYTSSEDILEGINSAVRANPNIDIREAALLSTIEYVCDFVCNQLTLTS